MKGANHREEVTIQDFIFTEDSLAVHPDLLQNLQKGLSKVDFAAIFNVAWRFDRPYPLDVDAPRGCAIDFRGATEYRICLEEHP